LLGWLRHQRATCDWRRHPRKEKVTRTKNAPGRRSVVTAQYFEDQKLRGSRYCLGRRRSRRLAGPLGRLTEARISQVVAICFQIRPGHLPENDGRTRGAHLGGKPGRRGLRVSLYASGIVGDEPGPDSRCKPAIVNNPDFSFFDTARHPRTVKQ
jgi:hypothetical protein